MAKAKKITKDHILLAAYNLVKRQSFIEFSARNIAREANCSTQPIYYEYTSLDLLRNEVVLKALQELVNHAFSFNQYEGQFLNVCLGYLDYIFNEPHLYQLLHFENKLNVFLSNPKVFNKMKMAIMSDFPDVDHTILQNGLMRTWLFTLGLGINASLESNGEQLEMYSKMILNTMKDCIK